MPINSPYGFLIGICSFLFAFGLIWYMYWMAILGFLGIIIFIIKHLSIKHPEYNVLASEIAKMERKGRRA